ncbi:MAG: radical SAM protein [Desulfobacteraceae bacterium]
MKVLLVNPVCLDDRKDQTDASSVSMGLYYIAAFLMARQIDVHVVNLAPVKEPYNFLDGVLEREKPGMVGVSVVSATRFSAMEIACRAKSHDPGIKTVFGGAGATFLARSLLSICPDLDYVVKGEGEATFFELYRHVAFGDPPCPDQIRGLLFRENGFSRNRKIRETDDREVIENLDILPKPGAFFDLEHVSLSRGCPGRCTFCGSPAFWGRKVRFHSPRWFVDHLELLVNRGITHFYVSDDTFTMERERVINVCDLIMDRNLEITWAAISRVDFLDETLLFKMRKAGCIQISFGVESGSETIRKSLGKPVKQERIISAFRMTAFHGILTRAYFIYGSPGENDETIAETMALMDIIKPLSAVFYLLVVFPGTALYQRLKQDQLVDDGIWQEKIEDIPWFQKEKQLDFQTVKAYGKKLRTGYYAAVSRFAAEIELVDNPALYACHGDFLSRLGMTFSHGDYAGNPAVKESDETAEQLFHRSLEYGPNARAYLGLGMLHQKKRAFARAAAVFEKGIETFAGNKPLNVGMAVSLMNLGRFENALDYLEKFHSHRDVKPYIKACRQRGV